MPRLTDTTPKLTPSQSQPLFSRSGSMSPRTLAHRLADDRAVKHTRPKLSSPTRPNLLPAQSSPAAVCGPRPASAASPPGPSSPYKSCLYELDETALAGLRSRPTALLRSGQRTFQGVAELTYSSRAVRLDGYRVLDEAVQNAIGVREECRRETARLSQDLAFAFDPRNPARREARVLLNKANRVATMLGDALQRLELGSSALAVAYHEDMLLHEATVRSLRLSLRGCEDGMEAAAREGAGSRMAAVEEGQRIIDELAAELKQASAERERIRAAAEKREAELNGAIEAMRKEHAAEVGALREESEAAPVRGESPSKSEAADSPPRGKVTYESLLASLDGERRARREESDRHAFELAEVRSAAAAAGKAAAEKLRRETASLSAQMREQALAAEAVKGLQEREVAAHKATISRLRAVISEALAAGTIKGRRILYTVRASAARPAPTPLSSPPPPPAADGASPR